MSQFSEHDPMQAEAAMIRSLGSHDRRGRWQRLVMVIGAGALGVLAVVLITGVVLRH